MFGFGKKIRILAVDDDAQVLGTLKKILEKKSYEVLGYTNPVDALARLKTGWVDLILTDLKMPEMDGLQFLEKAKRISPATPIILITAFATIETAVSAIRWGAYDYLTKPFEIKKICEVVKRCLKSQGK